MINFSPVAHFSFLVGLVWQASTVQANNGAMYGNCVTYSAVEAVHRQINRLVLFRLHDVFPLVLDQPLHLHLEDKSYLFSAVETVEKE